MFYGDGQPAPGLLEQHLTVQARPALQMLRARLAGLATWEKPELAAAIKEVLAGSGLKMPQLAMPLRVMVAGRTQTPSIDATLELIGREQVLARMAKQLQAFPT